MKQKIYILGLVAAMIVSAGAIFKVNHWPAAGILLVIGMLTLVLIFLPAAILNNYKAEGNKQNRLLYIVTYLTCLVVFVAMLFKIMHWPYAGYGLLIALPFPYVIFLPVFLAVTSKNKNFSIYNTVFVLILLALNSVFSALLALNVSAGTINDSYNLSKDYQHVSSAVSDLPSTGGHEALNVRFDEVLKVVNNYRDILLKHEEITPEQWKSNPGNLMNPLSPDIPMNIMVNNGDSYPGEKLQSSLKALYDEMAGTKGCEEAAKALPAIIGVADETGTKPDWTKVNVDANNLSWVMIYLDGLEANLKMMKTSGVACK
jgi:hypothetical protein